MELIIVKNGHIFARATDGAKMETDSYELRQEANLPEYPQEQPPKGKYYELDYLNGGLAWILKDRPLTIEERVEQMEEKQYLWKAGEQVYSATDSPSGVADRRYHDGVWYSCVQSHFTQADWTPDIVPALWKKD